MATREDAVLAPLNEVRLVGRVAAPAQERAMPSGDVLCTFRVSVTRDDNEAGRAAGRQRVDSLECATWSGRVRRSARAWQPGDEVEVRGALRRRFFRTAGGTGSRVEVEVTSARRLRRAQT
ncbi:single-stranded DNA-binding protein [Nocardioides sp.]|uniref:single-stranded DNA-binding protein n=1 Tax=Nocardioides sp. TaxID=35761 RepID=UPI002B26D563|nr:single-stranded DNA-binding protein [Nocardioides sp.]